MTKRDQEAQLRRVINMAKVSKLALESTIARLAHLESEATSALLALGSTIGQTPKGKVKQIRANLTAEDMYIARYGKKPPKTA